MSDKRWEDEISAMGDDYSDTELELAADPGQWMGLPSLMPLCPPTLRFCSNIASGQPAAYPREPIGGTTQLDKAEEKGRPVGGTRPD
jgi:hypothetical protein